MGTVIVAVAFSSDTEEPKVESAPTTVASTRCEGGVDAQLPEPLAPPRDSLGGSLYVNDFSSVPPGPYLDADVASGWDTPPWTNGVAENRVSVLGEAEAAALRVWYPAAAAGAQRSGAQWQLRFDDREAIYISYRVRFDDGFDFVRGGKLPGPAGGTANTGGVPPDGSDGWSARMMWREHGCAVFYAYHPDQPGDFGEDLPWNVEFEPGTWHRIEQVIVMNTPGRNDGVALGWLDGALALERRDLRYRDAPGLAIDMLYFSTFFGGNDPSWAPAADQFVDFDDFVVADIDPAAVGD